MSAAPAVTGAQRQLRVAWLWNGTLQGEEVLERPRPIVLGKDTAHPLPEGAPGDGQLMLLEPRGHGYALRLAPGLAGSVWRDGRREEVYSLASQGSSVPLGPDDYGVVTVGTIAVFFQHVRAAKKPALRFMTLDAGLAASVGLAAFLVAAFLLIAFLDLGQQMREDPLELPADLIAKYMVVPPPEDILEELESGTETPDPGMREEEAGGRAHEGEEGRVGHEDARRENTELAGERTDVVAAKVRGMGLLGALNAEGGNAISAALEAPNVSDILGGLNAAETIIGRGSRGAGLRGTGQGGGGTGPGSLFGAGNLGTGTGVGRGNGTGRGAGGIGVPGRERREVQISVREGSPRVNGYLSPEQINRVVRANQAAIRYCYEVQVQRQPNLRGRIEINWRINLQGIVTSARVESSTMHDAAVEGCLVRQVRRWRFPQPDGGEVVVTYPFIFGVQGG